MLKDGLFLLVRNYAMIMEFLFVRDVAFPYSGTYLNILEAIVRLLRVIVNAHMWYSYINIENISQNSRR